MDIVNGVLSLEDGVWDSLRKDSNVVQMKDLTLLSCCYDPSSPGRPDPQFSVDSLKFNDPVGYNAKGYPRDAGEFWKNWAKQNPNSLSSSNQYLIDNYDRLKVSPRVDQTWIDALPEHGDYMGDVLVHHHVDFGRYTIPVPGNTHVGSGGPWHQ